MHFNSPTYGIIIQKSSKNHLFYRSGQLLNILGEKVTQVVTDRAIKEAASQWDNVSVADYACAESLSLSEESLKSKSSIFIIMMLHFLVVRPKDINPCIKFLPKALFLG